MSIIIYNILHRNNVFHFKIEAPANYFFVLQHNVNLHKLFPGREPILSVSTNEFPAHARYYR